MTTGPSRTPPPHAPESPLREYVQGLRRQAWLVILVPVISILAAILFLATREPVYRASTTLVVGEPRVETAPVLGSSSTTRTLTNLLESDLVARTVIENLDLDVSQKAFLQKLRVDVLPDTSVLDVSYDDADADEALAVITDITEIFTRSLGGSLGVSGGDEDGAPPGADSFDLIVRVFDEPHLEDQPIGRNWAATLAFVGAVGIALGLMLAIAREALDASIRKRQDAEEWFGAPVVGTIPKGAHRGPPFAAARSYLPGFLRKRRAAAQTASVDLLRARLEFSQIGLGGPSIAVTSARAGEGKSTVAASLGAALARAGKRVICVDADVRRPALYRYLSLPQETPGLLDVVRAGVDVDEALLTIELTQSSRNGAAPPSPPVSFEVLLAGNSNSGTRGLRLEPDEISKLIETLQERADYIILDSPPLLVADAFLLAAQAGNVLIVARHGRTTKDQAESVRTTLEELGVQHVGVVLTNAPPVETYYR